MPYELEFYFTTEAIYWWIFLAVIWFSQRTVIGYRRVNTFTFFYPLLLITNGIFVPFTRDINKLLTGVAVSSFERYWLALGLMYIFIPLGAIVANSVMTRRQLNSAPSIVLTVSSMSRTQLYVVAIVIICTFALGQIFAKGISFDLLSYITGQMDNATYTEHRDRFGEAVASFDFYIYQKLHYGIAPLAIIILANLRRIALWKRGLLLLLLLYATIQSGHKQPVVIILGYIFLSQLLIRSNLQLSRQVLCSLAIGALGVVLAVLPMFYWMQGIRNYQEALFWSVERLVFEPQRTLQLFFEVYPQQHPHLYGLSSQTIAALLGIEDYVRPSLYIPRVVLGLDSTSFPALFIGEAWADFGYAGVVGLSILVGFILQSYNIWYFRKQRAFLEDVALFLSIVFGSLFLLENNFMTTLLTYGLVSNLIIHWAIRVRRPMTYGIAATMSAR